MSSGGQLRKRIQNAQQGGALSNQKKRDGILGEIDALGMKQNILQAQTRKSYEILDSRVQQLNTVVDAIAEILGVDVVSAKVQELFIRRAEEGVARNDALIEQGLAEGRLAAAETVTENCDLVLQEKNAEGTVLHPSKVHTGFGDLTDAFKALVLGKKVGDVVESPVTPGNTLAVLGIYTVVEPSDQAGL